MYTATLLNIDYGSNSLLRKKLALIHLLTMVLVKISPSKRGILNFNNLFEKEKWYTNVIVYRLFWWNGYKN